MERLDAPPPPRGITSPRPARCPASIALILLLLPCLLAGCTSDGGRLDADPLHRSLGAGFYRAVRHSTGLVVFARSKGSHTGVGAYLQYKPPKAGPGEVIPEMTFFLLEAPAGGGMIVDLYADRSIPWPPWPARASPQGPMRSPPLHPSHVLIHDARGSHKVPVEPGWPEPGDDVLMKLMKRG